MKKNFFVNTLTALAVLIGTQSVWSADTATDAAQVQLQASSRTEIEAQAETTGGYKPKDVELSSTAHQMTITVIDSKLNNGASAKREEEATRMVSTITRLIADKPAFSQLPVIHVDYVKRQGSKRKEVQRIDFYKSPAGAYVLHKT